MATSAPGFVYARSRVSPQLTQAKLEVLVVDDDQETGDGLARSGLGLYIARRVVFSRAGTLDVRSADGTTTFVMRLPRVPPDPPGDAP